MGKRRGFDLARHERVQATLARYRDDLPQVYLREVGESWYVCAKGDPGAVLFQPVHP